MYAKAECFEGNFWSDYTDPDFNRDGLGDSPNPINGSESDRYPPLGVFHSFNVYHNGSFHEVTTVTNSTILDFAYHGNNSTMMTITLMVMTIVKLKPDQKPSSTRSEKTMIFRTL